MKKYKVNEEIVQFKRFCCQRENKNKFILFFIVSLIMGGIFWHNNNKINGKLIKDDKGKIIGIYKHEKKSATFPLTLEVSNGKEKIKEEIILSIKGNEEKGIKNGISSANAKSKYDVDSELKRVISDVRYYVEKQETSKIKLPKKHNGKYYLKWSRVSNNDLIKFFFIPFILFIILYFDFKKKDRDVIRNQKDSIVRNLPLFSDQLIIMFQCGLIFSDAFYRIVNSYEEDNKNDYFKNIIINIKKKYESGNRSLINIFYEDTSMLGHRSLSRLSNLIMNNQKKGVDMTFKLKENGELIREERKSNAIERGKLAESKLTLPLAMLLLVLIIVTAAPALLQVKGI